MGSSVQTPVCFLISLDECLRSNRSPEHPPRWSSDVLVFDPDVLACRLDLQIFDPLSSLQSTTSHPISNCGCSFTHAFDPPSSQKEKPRSTECFGIHTFNSSSVLNDCISEDAEGFCDLISKESVGDSMCHALGIVFDSVSGSRKLGEEGGLASESKTVSSTVPLPEVSCSSCLVGDYAESACMGRTPSAPVKVSRSLCESLVASKGPESCSFGSVESGVDNVRVFVKDNGVLVINVTIVSENNGFVFGSVVGSAMRRVLRPAGISRTLFSIGFSRSESGAKKACLVKSSDIGNRVILSYDGVRSRHINLFCTLVSADVCISDPTSVEPSLPLLHFYDLQAWLHSIISRCLQQSAGNVMDPMNRNFHYAFSCGVSEEPEVEHASALCVEYREVVICPSSSIPMRSSMFKAASHSSSLDSPIGPSSKIGSGLEDDSLPSSSSKRGKHRNSVAASGVIRRSDKVRSFHSSSSGEFPDSSAACNTANSGSGMAPVLGSTYSTYALGTLSTSEICQLADDTAFVFTDVEIDIDYIRSRELERVISLGL